MLKSSETDIETKKKADLEERLGLITENERRYVLGNIKSPTTISTFSTELLAPIYFSLEKIKKRIVDTKDGKPVKDNVELFVDWLSIPSCQKNVSTRAKVMIMNFQDFKKAGYKRKDRQQLIKFEKKRQKGTSCVERSCRLAF